MIILLFKKKSSNTFLVKMVVINASPCVGANITINNLIKVVLKI